MPQMFSNARPDNVGRGTYFFFGGLLLILSTVMEFILGNTFPMVVFGCLGQYDDKELGLSFRKLTGV